MPGYKKTSTPQYSTLQVLLLGFALLIVQTSADAFFLPSLDSVLGNSVPRIHRLDSAIRDTSVSLDFQGSTPTGTGTQATSQTTKETEWVFMQLNMSQELKMIETIHFLKIFIIVPPSSPDTLGTSPTHPSRSRPTTLRNRWPASRDPISPLRHHGPLTPVPM